MKSGIAVAATLALMLAGCGASEEVDVGDVVPPAVAPAGEGEEEMSGMPEMPTEDAQRAASEAAQRQAEEGVVYVGAGRNGSDVMLAAGETLRIELETVPTAGYVWQIVEQPNFLELTGENTRATNPAVQNQAGFTGGNHYMSFDLKGGAPGTGLVKLEEGRPWESGEEPMGRFELTVTVAAAE